MNDRPRLVLDSNMLVVIVIGSIDPELLGTVKGVKEYEPADYDIILDHAGQFNSVVLLPNMVSEAGNLIDWLKGPRRKRGMELFAEFVRKSAEIYVPSSQAMSQPEYMEFGVTDAATLCILDRHTHLLTADYNLYAAAIRRSRIAKHFPELRG